MYVLVYICTIFQLPTWLLASAVFPTNIIQPSPCGFKWYSFLRVEIIFRPKSELVFRSRQSIADYYVLAGSPLTTQTLFVGAG